MIIQEKIIFFPNLVDMFREISWFLTFAFQWRQARCRPIWKQPQVHRIAWTRGYKSLSLNGRQVNHQIFSLCRVPFSGEGLFGILIPLSEYLLSSFRLPLYRKVCCLFSITLQPSRIYFSSSSLITPHFIDSRKIYRWKCKQKNRISTQTCRGFKAFSYHAFQWTKNQNSYVTLKKKKKFHLASKSMHNETLTRKSVLLFLFVLNFCG